MRLTKYMMNEGMLNLGPLKSIWSKIQSELSNMSFQEMQKKAEASWLKVKEMLSDEDLARLKVPSNESILIKEDIKHWWGLVKTEAFPTLAFYPALQVWLELDKVIKGSSYDERVMAFYAALWVVLMTGKYMAGWMKWKKDQPEEYHAERKAGKGGII